MSGWSSVSGVSAHVSSARVSVWIALVLRIAPQRIRHHPCRALFRSISPAVPSRAIVFNPTTKSRGMAHASLAHARALTPARAPRLCATSSAHRPHMHQHQLPWSLDKHSPSATHFHAPSHASHVNLLHARPSRIRRIRPMSRVTG